MFQGFFMVITSGLPDYLYVDIRSEKFIQISLYTAVDRPCTQTAADHQNSLLIRGEAEELQGFLTLVRRLFQILTDRIAGHDDTVGREELLHAFVGDTYFTGFLCQELIRDTCIGILLLYQGRDS